MKAKIDPGDTEWYLTLTPETEDDKTILGVLGRCLFRYEHTISCREIGYMRPTIDFVISKKAL